MLNWYAQCLIIVSRNLLTGAYPCLFIFSCDWCFEISLPKVESWSALFWGQDANCPSKSSWRHWVNNVGHWLFLLSPASAHLNAEVPGPWTLFQHFLWLSNLVNKATSSVGSIQLMQTRASLLVFSVYKIFHHALCPLFLPSFTFSTYDLESHNFVGFSSCTSAPMLGMWGQHCHVGL